MEANKDKKPGRGIEGKDLLAQVKAGVASIYKSGAWKEALIYNARFWNYSFGNQLLIIMQKPDASRVAGFQTWKAQGRTVRKGEKGLAILRPVFLGGSKAQAVDVVDPASGQAVGQVKQATGRGPVRGFTVTYVFDVSQTDGKPAPEYLHKLKGAAPAGLFKALTDYAAGLGLPVAAEPMAESLGGFVRKAATPGGAEIRLNASNDEAQQVKTLIHELGHFLAGHLTEKRMNATREEKELEAESAAFIVGQALGVDFSEYSFGYLANWAASMDPDAREKALEKAGTMAARVAKQILEGLDPATKAAAAQA